MTARRPSGRRGLWRRPAPGAERAWDTSIERITKVLVVACACAGLWLELSLISGWNGLRPLGAAAFGLAALATALDRRAIAGVLTLACIFPVVIRLGHGQYDHYFAALWMALLLGALLPHAIGRPWHLPAPWRAPLVCWALTICVSAIVVVVREIDFYPALLGGGRAWRSVGPPPPFMAAWVLQVALGLVLGILWFDWLFSFDRRLLARWVIGPFAASAAIMSAVAIYQLVFDLGFVNETVYAHIGRASGTVYDANLCGTLAALWFGAGVVLTGRLGRIRPFAVAVIGAAAWLAVWASGSRTGFAAALIVSAFTLAGYAAGLAGSLRARLVRAVPAAVAVALVAVVVVTLVGRDRDAVGPWGRIRQTLPGLSIGSVSAFAAEMWNRNGYGAAATEAIRQFPLFGIGIGAFHSLAGDFLAALSRRPLPPDNAQNWYRHQLVELGLVGSAGWIAFVASFVAFLLRQIRRAPPSSAPVAGGLVALGVISLVGMPGQHVIVGLTFWTLAFWYVSLTPAAFEARPVSRSAWAAIAVVLLVFAAGSARLAAHDLRPPMRAQRAGWPYTYGFYAPEPDGRGGERRWAGRRAVVVLEATGSRLALTLSVNHHDLAAQPVDVAVRVNGAAVYAVTLRDVTPATTVIAVAAGERIVLETVVSRVVRPRELGLPDDRELGVMAGWTFPRD